MLRRDLVGLGLGLMGGLSDWECIYKIKSYILRSRRAKTPIFGIPFYGLLFFTVTEADCLSSSF